MRLYIYIILYYCTLVTICISPQCALKIEFYRKLESFTCTFHLLDSQQVFVGFLLVLGAIVICTCFLLPFYVVLIEFLNSYAGS